MTKKGGKAKKSSPWGWVAVLAGVFLLANYCQSQPLVDQGKLAGTAVGAAGAYGAGKGLASRGGGGGAAGGGGGSAAAAKEKEEAETTTPSAPPPTAPPTPAPEPEPEEEPEPANRITIRPTPFGSSQPELEPLPMPAQVPQLVIR